MVYRRFRRNFGRQPVRPTRMTVRIIVLLVLAATLAPVALRGGEYLAAQAAGAAAGIALALWGASRTKFVRDGGALFYLPHTYTGLAVSALILGRIVYRFAQLYPAGGLSPPGSPALDAQAAMVKSPLTVGLFFVLIGYYVCYYGRVLWKSRRVSPADLEAPAAASDPASEGLLPGQIEESDRQ